ncbi:MAG: PstS family phosphate ABC transporter substrate-binding protein [Planctomycetota bacterium]
MLSLNVSTRQSLFKQCFKMSCMLCILLIGTASLIRAQDRAGLSDAPAYAPEKPIAGQIELVGSTLMQPLATLWMEDFTKIHPELVSKVDCQGSEESFKKLADSPNVIGLLSREVTADELARWNKEHNKKLIAIEVGYDILSMIVHKDNPIRALAWNSHAKSPMSLSNDKPIEKWSDLGVDGTLGEKPITHILIVSSHGLRSVAEGVFNLKDRNSAVIVQKDNQPDIVDTVGATPEAIAVVSANRALTDSVRSLAIAVDGQKIVSPRSPQAIDLGYPLLRKLSVVVSQTEDGKLTPAVEELTKFILSQAGQETLIKDGLVPLDRSDIATQQEKLGWQQLK